MIIDDGEIYVARNHSNHPENYPFMIIDGDKLYKAREHSHHPENYPFMIIDGYYNPAILAAIIWECQLLQF